MVSIHVSPRFIANLAAYFLLTVSWLSMAYHARGDSAATANATGPRAGDVYREFATHNTGNLDWRVTDPNARTTGARKFLPNPVLQIEVGSLKGALRAEAVLDRWGGHLRTTGKRVRFNQQDWITIPEISTTPKDRAPYYYSQDNPVVPVPLAHLREGTNSFEGTCGVVGDYNWGQWGLYSLILRIYYDPLSVAHPTGRIVTPRTGDAVQDQPHIALQAQSPNGVSRVDVLAWYEGYDVDGDGIFKEWQGSFFQRSRGGAAKLGNHIGTALEMPYRVLWDTRWVPDQRPQAVKLIARIQDSRGLWFVTDPVEQLTLVRDDVSVRMYRTVDLPERFGVRVDRTASCTIPLPPDAPLKTATAAVLALRTWHGWDGHHEPLRLNGHAMAIQGKNHFYDFDLLPIPTNVIKHNNELLIHSKTEHHMLEVLWPGPAILVRYAK